jgi:MFS family permease
VRRLLVLVSSTIFVDAMLFGALTPLIPGYADEFGLSKVGAGLLAGAFGAGALVGGVPAGLAALRVGPKRTVVLGLVVLAVASFAFAVSGGPWTLGLSRFVQGLSSTMTWAGALGWLTVETPRERRGETIGTAFGAAVLGAILGPLFGAIADLIGVRAAFGAVGIFALLLAGWAGNGPRSAPEQQAPDAARRAFSDPRFVGGLWLITLPALLFGALTVLAPLALGDHDFGALAIGIVFLTAGLVEVAINPLLGRFSDRVGRLLPARLALAASVVVAGLLAAASNPIAIAALVCAAAIAFGGFYTPGMALVSDRAETAGLAQGLAFCLISSAWAVGNATGPAAAGALAERFGDAVPYGIGALICLATLLVAERIARGAVLRPVT